jgi:serine/threonine protein phosphatase PrpC
MSDIRVSVFARTDIGMQRSGNEDAFLVADLTTGNIGLGPDMSTHKVGERGSLMVVSDGMGGAVAGEVASEMAVTTIRESLMEMPSDMSISERLKLATEVANERIWQHAEQNPELSGMGATVTAVLVKDTTVYIAQVGDSRAYIIRGAQIKQITKDQSLAQMLVDSGAIKPEQMDLVPQNVIMQALGTQPTVNVVMTAVTLCRNDYLLVCSDGLSNKVNPPEMRQIIQESENLTVACRRMVETANQRGGEDNITVIIARFDGEALHAASEGVTITGSFRALSEDYTNEQAAGMTSRLASAPPPSPDKEITTLVMPALSASALAEAQAEAAEQPPEERAPVNVPLAAPAQTTPEAAPAQPQAAAVAGKKKSYAPILIIAIAALLLLAATGYFAYKRYFKPQPRPAPEQQEEQPATEPVG